MLRVGLVCGPRKENRANLSFHGFTHNRGTKISGYYLILPYSGWE